MFPQFKTLNNESGVVLFMVLMVAIIIMIVSVSILTQSANENNYAQQQIDQIASDQMAKGMFWNSYSTAFAAGNISNMLPGGPASSAINQSSRTYATVISATATANQYSAVTQYDTFN